MPTFDDSTTTPAPVEEVWKLLYDPARFPEWWEGIETRRRRGRDGQGDITIYPRGYPDFPMPQELRTDADGRGLTISCLVSYLVFEWRLEPLGRRHAHRACTSRSPRRRRTASRRSARE